MPDQTRAEAYDKAIAAADAKHFRWEPPQVTLAVALFLPLYTLILLFAVGADTGSPRVQGTVTVIWAVAVFLVFLWERSIQRKHSTMVRALQERYLRDA